MKKLFGNRHILDSIIVYTVKGGSRHSFEIVNL